ncbi:hypothetical protein FOA52_003426 [Chlamydomonas sp. UWO 241]|nr:hypothetical protein FOA52_003426 [Chlamydomonas sp. UWO 241]
MHVYLALLLILATVSCDGRAGHERAGTPSPQGTYPRQQQNGSSKSESDAAPPSINAPNVSGTWQGVWRLPDDDRVPATQQQRAYAKAWRQFPPGSAAISGARSTQSERAHGLLVLVLESRLAQGGGGASREVQGEIILHDGMTLDGKEVHVAVEGLFAPATGRLTAVLKRQGSGGGWGGGVGGGGAGGWAAASGSSGSGAPQQGQKQQQQQQQPAAEAQKGSSRGSSPLLAPATASSSSSPKTSAAPQKTAAMASPGKAAPSEQPGAQGGGGSKAPGAKGGGAGGGKGGGGGDKGGGGGGKREGAKPSGGDSAKSSKRAAAAAPSQQPATDRPSGAGRRLLDALFGQVLSLVGSGASPSSGEEGQEGGEPGGGAWEEESEEQGEEGREPRSGRALWAEDSAGNWAAGGASDADAWAAQPGWATAQADDWDRDAERAVTGWTEGTDVDQSGAGRQAAAGGGWGAGDTGADADADADGYYAFSPGKLPVHEHEHRAAPQRLLHHVKAWTRSVRDATIRLAAASGASVRPLVRALREGGTGSSQAQDKAQGQTQQQQAQQAQRRAPARSAGGAGPGSAGGGGGGTRALGPVGAAAAARGGVATWLMQLLHLQKECQLRLDLQVAPRSQAAAAAAAAAGSGSGSGSGRAGRDRVSLSASPSRGGVGRELLEGVRRILEDYAPSAAYEDYADDDPFLDLPPVSLFRRTSRGGGGGGSSGGDNSGGGGRGGIGFGGGGFGFGGSFVDLGDLSFTGVLYSPNCGNVVMELSGTIVDRDRLVSKVEWYCAAAACVAVVQALVLMSQMWHTGEAADVVSRLSLMSLAHQAILDAYLFMFHLTLGLVLEVLFWPLQAVALLHFALFAALLMRYMVITWRVQRGGSPDWSPTHEMSVLYTRFYAALLLVVLTVRQLTPAPVGPAGGEGGTGGEPLLTLMLMLAASFWTPQIFHSTVTNTRPPFTTVYLYCTTVCRLVLPLYVTLCPGNLLGQPARPAIAAAMVVWMGAQVAVLEAQRQWGPHALLPVGALPAWVLPARYDYRRAATRRELGLDEPLAGVTKAGVGADAGTCVHAHNPLTAAAAASGAGGGVYAEKEGLQLPLPLAQAASAGSGGEGDQSDEEEGCRAECKGPRRECVICMSNVALSPPGDRLLTPCGHFFHEACLARWSQIKLECPTCRRALPPLP